jgi:hypothetical protein
MVTKLFYDPGSTLDGGRGQRDVQSDNKGHCGKTRDIEGTKTRLATRNTIMMVFKFLTFLICSLLSK